MTFKREDGCMTAAIESVADLCERFFRKLAAEIHSKGAWLCDRINPASPGYLCRSAGHLVMAGRAPDPFLREDGPGLLDGGGVNAFWCRIALEW